MPIRTARPYAAKAIVEHEFDTDHLNIWVTFRFPMNQDVKPANAKWIVEVDDVVKAVTASAWQDDWTMLLTVAAIAAWPERVTLEYDGPDENLKIVWGKQWEPWGPILSVDGSLLAYGNFHGNEIAWVQVAAQNVWYDILDADIALVGQNKMTFQNNGQFKIAVAGWYSLDWAITCESSIANKHVLGSIGKNGVNYTPAQTHVEYGRANEEGPMSMPSLALLAVDDLITVGVETPDAGNPTLTVDHVGLTIVEIGKT